MIAPYYQDDHVTLYHGDCREILPALDGDAVVITDPPYGTGAYASDVKVLTGELLRGFAERGAAVFGWPELLVKWCVEAGTSPLEWITWWPTNGAIRGFNPVGLWRESECIAAWAGFDWKALRTERSNSVPLDRYNSGNSGNRRLSSGNPESRHMGDVWRQPSPGLGFQSAKRLHPNEKPIEVLRLLVTACTADTVIDPFAGSGTTLRAAKDLGRKAIGIELDERYCEIAAERLGQEVLDFGGVA